MLGPGDAGGGVIMKSEKWLEICKEMAPHLRALELIAENNALDIICIGVGGKASGEATWIDDDADTFYTCTSRGGNSFKATISDIRADLFKELPLFYVEKAPGAGKQSGT